MALTREQSIEFGYVIEERRSALLDEIREETEAARELDELRAIEAAQRRLAEGNYGVCLTCGGEINYRRLRANPAAILCAGCQPRREETRSSPGGSSL